MIRFDSLPMINEEFNNLVEKKKEAEEKKDENDSENFLQAYHQLKKALSCSICLDFIKAPTSLPCSHTFCSLCITQALKQKESCPICCQKVKKNQLVNLKNWDETLSTFVTFFNSYETRMHLNSPPTKLKRMESKQVISSKKSFSEEKKRGTLYFNDTPDKSTDLQNQNSEKMEEVKENNEDSYFGEEKEVIKTAKFEIGNLVNVLPRTWSGINKLGGVGKIETVNEIDGVFYYRVKYALDNHRDENVPEEFIEHFQELDRSSRRNNKRSFQENSPITLMNSPAGLALSGTKPKKFRESTDFPSKSFPGPSSSSAASSSAAGAFTTPSRAKTPMHDISKPIRILLTCIEDKGEIEKKLEKMISYFKGIGYSISLEHHFTKDITHIVVSMDENGVVKQRTMKYMLGVAYGLWIVSTNWVQDCLKKQEIVWEEPYEIRTNSKAIIPQASKRCRELISNSEPRLFDGMLFLLYGSFPLPGPPRSDVSSLIEASQGTIHTAIPSFLSAINDLPKERRLARNIVVICGIISEELFNNSQSNNANVHELIFQDIFQQSLTDPDANEKLFVPVRASQVSIVSTLWLLDSITNYTIQGFQKYPVSV